MFKIVKLCKFYHNIKKNYSLVLNEARLPSAEGLRLANIREMLKPIEMELKLFCSIRNVHGRHIYLLSTYNQAALGEA